MRFSYVTVFSMFFFAMHALQPLYAAVPVNLKHQSNDFVKRSILSSHRKEDITFSEVSHYIDSQNVSHIRIQESYRGYPIWNAHAVIHATSTTKKHITSLKAGLLSNKAVTMNGLLYMDLATDLNQTFHVSASSARAKQIREYVLSQYRHRHEYAVINNLHESLLIYIDKDSKAHWAYKVNFFSLADRATGLPAKLNYIVDAVTFKIYHQWDDIKTVSHVPQPEVKGGGFGGNHKSGKLVYDGSSHHLSALSIQRSDAGICYLQNAEMTVKKYGTDEIMSFACSQPDPEHNNVYWNGEFGAVNGGYSPDNDAMFGGQIVKSLYRDWYGIPVLINSDGSEMMLNMFVHAPRLDNAYWNGESMTFGDGNGLYPLTALGIVAHEVSHGFTQQHADLHYYEQSGGLNESFSDMASQAAEFYARGASTWQLGEEVFKIENEALRYMDRPSKDCHGKEPGTFCSIDHIDQYYDGLDVHFSSGVYNRVFYLLSHSAEWDVKKAFHIMLHANASYWTPDINFVDAASCVVRAAQDFNYDTTAVVSAFKAVGIDATSACTSVS